MDAPLDPEPALAHDAARRRRDALSIFAAGERAAALPGARLGKWPEGLPQTGVQRYVVVAAGKAALRFHDAVIDVLVAGRPPGARIEGFVLAPEPLPRVPASRESPPRCPDAQHHRGVSSQVFHVRPRDVNEPTRAAVAATSLVLDAARSLGPHDALLTLVTGGGSSTLAAPWPGLPLAAKLDAIRLLTEDGATIDEINTLRRHLSAVKGGRLAEAASGAQAVHSLLVSDVDGDVPHVIGSGPCVADPSTFRQALALREEWPTAVQRHLEAGARGAIPETPKRLPEHVRHRTIVSPDDALRGAAARARAAGWNVILLSRPTPSLMAGCVATHLDAIRSAPAGTALLSVGEAPVELPWRAPRGGRAGHLAVALGTAIDADALLRGRVTTLVGATDGEDGTSGTAGGVVDADVLRRAEAAGLDPAGLLGRCESLRVLDAGGGTLPARETITNVQDLRVVLVGASPASMKEF